MEDADDLNESLNIRLEEDAKDLREGSPKVVAEEEQDASYSPKLIASSKHKSDIFFLEVDKQAKLPLALTELPESQPLRRLNKQRDHTSTIFPAGCMGCREDPPSDHITSPRRFLDATEAKDYTGHIDNTPRKRPSSGKPYNRRNPLTGVGVNTGELKRHSIRRKDGNPLLGEGYNNKNVTPSTTRIPPGGYSQGLW